MNATRQSALSLLGRPEALLALVRQGLAGALGGFLTFAILEPSHLAQENRVIDVSEILTTLTEGWTLTAEMGVLMGAGVTAFLILADELSSRRPLRMILRAAAGALAGALLGGMFIMLAQLLFTLFGLLFCVGGPIGHAAARTIGWGAFGVGIGLSAGLLSRSGRRVTQGCWGGALGGAAGGLMFDALAAITQAGTVSRGVGLTCMGLAIGLATALIEQASKVAWISFLTGSREGRQVVLHRDTVVLGRDELADIPLFGDHLVERRHAVLTLNPAPLLQETAVANLVRVDGTPVRQASLYDGAVVDIGRHRLRFHHRHLTGIPNMPQPPVPPGGDAGTQRVGDAGIPRPGTPAPLHPPDVSGIPNPVVAPQGAPVPLGAPSFGVPPNGATEPARLRLRVVGGPSAGASVSLLSPEVTLGRESGNSLQLMDGKVSRFHARVQPLQGAWVLADLGSTNGVVMNGLRVKRAGLLPGDQVALGDSVLVVEPEA